MANKKYSPYTRFKSWLLAGDDQELEEDILKVINPRAALLMFCKMKDVTIFLNEYFNNYTTMSKNYKESTNNHLDFYKMLKDIVKSVGFTKYDFTYFSHTKMNSDVKEIMKFFPHLKYYEVGLLNKLCEDTEEWEQIKELLGLSNPKKKKISKKEIKEYAAKELVDSKMIKNDETWTFERFKKAVSGEKM